MWIKTPIAEVVFAGLCFHLLCINFLVYFTSLVRYCKYYICTFIAP